MKSIANNLNGKVSVVIPVYNSEQTLVSLTERLISTLQGIGREFEIIFVDDGSTDGSWERLRELRKRWEDCIRLVRLSINSGQHNAILCGFGLVKGDVVITMDDDLQHPPEEIPALLRAIDQGYDVAIGAYERKEHGAFRNLAGTMIDSLQRRIFDLPAKFQLTSFRAIRRTVVDEVTKMEGAFPYITSMILANATRYTNIPVRHEPRRYGESTYTFIRSLSLALNLIFHYSSYPLQLIAVLCALAFTVSLILGLAVVIQVALFGSSVPGWASTIVVVAFSSAMTQLGLLILAIYVSRLHRQLTRIRAGYKIAEIDG